MPFESRYPDLNLISSAAFVRVIKKNSSHPPTKGAFTRQRKNGTDPTKTGTVPILFFKETVDFYPFRVGAIGAYGPDTERIRVHCFFAKTVGTVPVFVGSVPCLLCRVNAP